jgi:hypothetical protein
LETWGEIDIAGLVMVGENRADWIGFTAWKCRCALWDLEDR